jgi:hypothetical protein
VGLSVGPRYAHLVSFFQLLPEKRAPCWARLPNVSDIRKKGGGNLDAERLL